jgi:hypothetical protein
VVTGAGLHQRIVKLLVAGQVMAPTAEPGSHSSELSPETLFHD